MRPCTRFPARYSLVPWALAAQVVALWCTDTIKRHPVTRVDDEEAGEGKAAMQGQAAAPLGQQQAADIEMGLSNGREQGSAAQAAASRDVAATALD